MTRQSEKSTNAMVRCSRWLDPRLLRRDTQIGNRSERGWESETKPTGKTYPIELPDHYVITGFLKDGIIANVFWRGGYVSTPGRRQLIWEIEGDEGVIRMDLNGGSPDIVEPDLFLNGGKVVFENPGDVFDSLGIAWKEFVEGGSGSNATIEDAVKHHRLMEAIKESAENGNESPYRVSLGFYLHRS